MFIVPLSLPPMKIVYFNASGYAFLYWGDDVSFTLFKVFQGQERFSMSFIGKSLSGTTRFYLLCFVSGIRIDSLANWHEEHKKP